MAGALAARPLTASAARAGRFSIALAARGDEADVRRLLREHAFAGRVQVSLEREPDSAAAATIDGDVHQTIVARDRETGRMAAVAARSVRDAFLNGEPARLGYLGQLRIAAEFRRRRRLLDEGFAFCRSLHGTDGARVYLTSVVADNEPAHRLLALRRGPEAPRVMPVDRLVTLAIPVRRRIRVPLPRGYRLEEGSSERLAEIAACLWRHGRRRQFAPCWTMEDLRSPERTRGLEAGDFVVAARGGRVAGCVAVWDQRAFKQAVVRGYAGALAWGRPLVNLAAPLTGAPPLPPAGRPLAFAYLSHLAVDEGGDEADVAAALVAAGCARARRAGLDYVVVAVAASNPLLHMLSRHFRHRRYPSVLYLVYWPDGEPIARALDRRLPHPEVAVL
jgi:hypothetical protein